jgi:NodT family efflux transporter outer membrane factor (OMF) lipoprotein
MRRLRRTLATLAISTCLASCAVLGPNFTSPDSKLPQSYSDSTVDYNPGRAPTPVVGQEPDWHWWQQFHDDELDRLEQRAVAGNLDLQVALLRIVSARSQVQVARAQGLPSLSGTASANREQLGLAGILKSKGNSNLTGSSQASSLISGLEQPVNLFQLGFDASWELDLFGKVARSVESSKAQSDQEIESRNDALVSLEAEVAQTYFQLRAAQMLRDITLQQLSDQREIVSLTSNRFLSGLGNQPQVESSQAQLSSEEAQLPQYDQTIVTSSHALAVLTGQLPSALDAELQPSGVLPNLPPLVNIGIPSDLARRRPDIREAEAALHSSTAEIGVAVASLYPDITLSGTYGLRNTSTKYLFNWASKFYTFGPSVSLPIFEGGKLTANVTIARADAAADAITYRKTVLSALQEVEDSLVTLHDDGLRVGSLREAVASNQNSANLALNSYRTGLSTYIDVLTQENQLIQSQVQLDQAFLAESTDVVKLYKALGGGWQGFAVSPDTPEPGVGTLGTAGQAEVTTPELAPR